MPVQVEVKGQFSLTKAYSADDVSRIAGYIYTSGVLPYSGKDPCKMVETGDNGLAALKGCAILSDNSLAVCDEDTRLSVTPTGKEGEINLFLRHNKASNVIDAALSNDDVPNSLLLGKIHWYTFKYNQALNLHASSDLRVLSTSKILPKEMIETESVTITLPALFASHTYQYYPQDPNFRFIKCYYRENKVMYDLDETVGSISSTDGKAAWLVSKNGAILEFTAPFNADMGSGTVILEVR